MLVWKMAVRLVRRVWNSPKGLWRRLEEVWSYWDEDTSKSVGLGALLVMWTDRELGRLGMTG